MTLELEQIEQNGILVIVHRGSDRDFVALKVKKDSFINSFDCYSTLNQSLEPQCVPKYAGHCCIPIFKWFYLTAIKLMLVKALNRFKCYVKLYYDLNVVINNAENRMIEYVNNDKLRNYIKNKNQIKKKLIKNQYQSCYFYPIIMFITGGMFGINF